MDGAGWSRGWEPNSTPCLQGGILLIGTPCRREASRVTWSRGALPVVLSGKIPTVPLNLPPLPYPSPWDALCLKPRWGTLSMGVCRSFMNL